MARPLLTTTLALLCGFGCGDDGFTPIAPVEEDGPLAGMTDAHNEIRANAQPPPDPPLEPLVWDSQIAGFAQHWADHLADLGCPFPLPHSSNAYGENLYWGFGAPTTGPDAVRAWGGEQVYYDHEEDSCSFICGHYTQIVWRGTRRVGCGTSACPEDDVQIWVCNYDPAGNIAGQRPY
jgi:pathogenesis-related protein 1